MFDKISAQFLALFLAFTVMNHSADGGVIQIPNSDSNIEGHFDNFENEANYEVDWVIDTETQIITFTVTANTTGFVGFGVSKSGVMSGADIVIGGVFPNGTAYFADRFGISNTEPVEDYSQDWNLLAASETSSHTTLEFSRLLRTADLYQDIPITTDRMSIMWSFGETDTVAYHGSNRGSTPITFFQP